MIPPGTLVIASGRFSTAVRPEQNGNADGYVVSTAPGAHDGYAPHWVPDWCVKPAELGVNVCATPRGKCFCGLLHIWQPEQLDGGATWSS